MSNTDLLSQRVTKRPHLYLDSSELFTHHGRMFEVTLKQDDDNEVPWDRDDSRNIVTDFMSRDSKRPEYRPLYSDRGSVRYFDWNEAMKVAKRDGWWLPVDEIDKLVETLGRAPSKREVTAEAVRKTYERYKGWCNDEWTYVGVVVEDVESGQSESLWGIESDDEDYLWEVAQDLACGIHPLAEAHEAACLELCTD